MTVNVFLNFGGMFLRLSLDCLLKPWTYITRGYKRDLCKTEELIPQGEL